MGEKSLKRSTRRTELRNPRNEEAEERKSRNDAHLQIQAKIGIGDLQMHCEDYRRR